VVVFLKAGQREKKTIPALLKPTSLLEAVKV
jgi:hypothetical protein